MKISEMNDNQLAVFRLVANEANELVGGLENNIEDGIDVEKSKSFLADHEGLVNALIANVRFSREWKRMENLHFVTLSWMKERCERRIKKMGY